MVVSQASAFVKSASTGLTDQVRGPQHSSMDSDFGTVDKPFSKNIAQHTAGTTMADSDGQSGEHGTFLAMTGMAAGFGLLLVWSMAAMPRLRVVESLLFCLMNSLGALFGLRWSSVVEICPERQWPEVECVDDVDWDPGVRIVSIPVRRDGRLGHRHYEHHAPPASSDDYIDRDEQSRHCGDADRYGRQDHQGHRLVVRGVRLSIHGA